MRSNRLKLHIGASRIHRWLALVIGVQLLLWFTSGLVMSLLSIERVRGEHLVDREQRLALPAGPYAPADAVLAQAGGAAKRIEHRMMLGRPVIEVETNSGALRLFNARTANPLPPVDAAGAGTIALAAYKPKPSPAASVERVDRNSTEYKGPVPAWRVAIADAENTRIYVSDTGKIAAVRTGTWRLYDFFWGLHIMDWSEHENFNTWWLKAFAFGGLALALAGTVLLYIRWPRQRRKKDAPNAASRASNQVPK